MVKPAFLWLSIVLFGLAACAGDTCEAITEACHDVDPGDGDIHECHEMSEEGDAATCEAEYDDCIALCEAAEE
jgi:hypothetical protein